MTLGKLEMTTEERMLDRLDKLEENMETHKQCLLEIKNYLMGNDAKSILGNAQKAFNNAPEWSSSISKGLLNKPDLGHYYEDGMPRLDKYLAYVQIDNRSKPDGSREVYLLSNCCEIAVCKKRCAVPALDTVILNLVGLMHVGTMTMVDLKIVLRGRANLEMSVYNMLNKLTNNGELTSASIYGDVANQFRTIEIEIEKDEMNMAIVNTIYSSYGCMEENEPMWEDTVKGSAHVVVV